MPAPMARWVPAVLFAVLLAPSANLQVLDGLPLSHLPGFIGLVLLVPFLPARRSGGSTRGSSGGGSVPALDTVRLRSLAGYVASGRGARHPALRGLSLPQIDDGLAAAVLTAVRSSSLSAVISFAFFRDALLARQVSHRPWAKRPSSVPPPTTPFSIALFCCTRSDPSRKCI